MSGFANAEADRRMENVAALGTVVSINAGAATAVVQLGDLTTPSIPVGQLRAGALSFWWMPSVGEQVLVVSPSGDVAQAVVVCSVFAGNAPSSDAATPKIDLAGGTLEVNGTIIATGDVIASGKSLKSHTHPHGDPAGITGGPI